MATEQNVRIRRSLLELQHDYEHGNPKPLEDLMRAWKGIKDIPPEEDRHPGKIKRSFFTLGGFHGEPFRGGGWGSSAYWGGYCNHGNVLFPTWHRVYLFELEKALQSIEGCQDVMLPYWDETDEITLQAARDAAKDPAKPFVPCIPWTLTNEKFVLDGVEIDNPLRSYTFPKNITDHISGDNPNYSKPAGYETVRYPLSGLVGTKDDYIATQAHNAKFQDYEENVKILNRNVLNWLTSSITVHDNEGHPITIETNVKQKYKDCLEAPNYTVFSNTTSAAEWNSDRETIDPATGEPIPNDPYKVVVPLESPHNSIHLSVGGFELPGNTDPENADFSPIDDANGDMGENDTAGLDPIFFFHHCNVDRMFWVWQKKHTCTNQLDIIPEYPGTNTVDNQGPTPGFAPNSWLTLESPLTPFVKEEEDGRTRSYTSLDCINIEAQLDYTYSVGSLDDIAAEATLLQEKTSETAYDTRTIKISRINKAPIRGSFLVSAFVNIDGKKQHLGTEAVLSRWNSRFCSNCQTHLEVRAFFKLPVINNTALQSFARTSDAKAEPNAAVAATPEVVYEIKGHDGLLAGGDEQTKNDIKPLSSTGKPLTGVHFKVI